MATLKQYDRMIADERKGRLLYLKLGLKTKLKTEKRLYARMRRDEDRHALWLDRMKHAEAKRQKRRR